MSYEIRQTNISGPHRKSESKVIMLIERAQGATEPRLDWVSVRLYNYNRKCERSNKNETEKEEVNSRVDISAHPADSPLHLQRLRSMEQQQKSLQGENSTLMIYKKITFARLPKEFISNILFKNSNVGGHCLEQIICFGLWSRGILTKLPFLTSPNLLGIKT